MNGNEIHICMQNKTKKNGNQKASNVHGERTRQRKKKQENTHWKKWETTSKTQIRNPKSGQVGIW